MGSTKSGEPLGNMTSAILILPAPEDAISDMLNSAGGSVTCANSSALRHVSFQVICG